MNVLEFKLLNSLNSSKLLNSSKPVLHYIHMTCIQTSNRFSRYPCKTNRGKSSSGSSRAKKATSSQDQTLLRRRVVSNIGAAETRLFSDCLTSESMADVDGFQTTTATASGGVASQETRLGGRSLVTRFRGQRSFRGTRKEVATEDGIDEEQLASEWEKCARAVDRLFFWLFTAMSILAIANVFSPITW